MKTIRDLTEKYTALVEEEPTEFWDAADWAYHYAYVEILSDLSDLDIPSKEGVLR